MLAAWPDGDSPRSPEMGCPGGPAIGGRVPTAREAAPPSGTKPARVLIAHPDRVRGRGLAEQLCEEGHRAVFFAGPLEALAAQVGAPEFAEGPTPPVVVLDDAFAPEELMGFGERLGRQRSGGGRRRALLLAGKRTWRTGAAALARWFTLVPKPVPALDIGAWLDLPSPTPRGRVGAAAANADPLTGMLNRQEFIRGLHAHLERGACDGGEHALCLIDIDHFKVINDNYGHAAGDLLLRQFAALLPGIVRATDTVARVGSDEFAILMPNCSASAARRAAEALHYGIGQARFNWRGRPHRISASIGIVALSDAAAYRSDGEMDLLAAAEQACTGAKQLGGGRTRALYTDDHALLERQSTVRCVLRIQRALEQDRFQLWHQPIRAIQGADRGEHYEILLRMQDEDGRIIAPNGFLPVAEQFRLGARIDQWVVRHTLDCLARHARRAASLGMCSINLSGQSVCDEAFLEFVIRELGRCPFDISKICFEITETAVITNLQAATRFMGRLRRLGVRFALDDFGSGLSSFAYLRTLPVDFIKIDGIFVKGIADNPTDRAMVKSIHEVAETMGKRTVGEFAATPSVLAVLRELGVHYAQGYAIGEPRPLEEDTPPGF